VDIGKKWAEIAKRLKTRTENAVKNRYNSLIKKYKTDIDSGLNESPLSTQTGASMDDIEKRISELLIDEKRKEMSDSKIPSINEEDEFNEKTNEEFKSSLEEEDRKKKLQKKKSGGSTDINKFMNNLKEFVQEDNRQNKIQSMQQSVQQGDKSPLIPQGISQIQGTMNMNGLFNMPIKQEAQAPKFNNFPQPTQVRQDTNGTTKQEPLMNLLQSISNMGGENPQNKSMNEMLNLNLLMMNSNNLNVFSANIQQPQTMSGASSPPLSMCSPKLKPSTLQSNYRSQPNSGVFDNFSSNNHNSNNFQESMPQFNLIKENKPFIEEPKVHRLVEKATSNFQFDDSNNQQYAIVDHTTGNIFFLTKLTNENFPPQFVSTSQSIQQQQNQLKQQQIQQQQQQQQQQHQNFQQMFQHQQLQHNQHLQQQQQQFQRKPDIRRGPFPDLSQSQNSNSTNQSLASTILNNPFFNIVKPLNSGTIFPDTSQNPSQHLQHLQQLQQHQQEMANSSNNIPKFESFNYTPELTPRQNPKIHEGQRMNYIWGNYKGGDGKIGGNMGNKIEHNGSKDETNFFS
jgi:Myb-like DNA-binding domain